MSLEHVHHLLIEPIIIAAPPNCLVQLSKILHKKNDLIVTVFSRALPIDKNPK